MLIVLIGTGINAVKSRRTLGSKANKFKIVVMGHPCKDAGTSGGKDPIHRGIQYGQVSCILSTKCTDVFLAHVANNEGVLAQGR